MSHCESESGKTVSETLTKSPLTERALSLWRVGYRLACANTESMTWLTSFCWALGNLKTVKTGSGSFQSIGKVPAGPMSRPNPGEILGLGFDHDPESIPAKCGLLL